ncbi:DapH/DapD/GlmU-related protein [Rhodococcus sp. NPDC080181]|uniref:DapH/DapD/GlmU-related protein n=1 Tax=Rhodococcus sp. NPDC080181 TaxID=3155292 RepID=UPI003450E375
MTSARRQTKDELYNPSRSQRRLGSFTGTGYTKGRNVVVQVAWLAISSTVFTQWWCPNRLRILILRLFGASIGTGVIIRHQVIIHWPWKLSIGNNTWVGQQAWLLNLEPITIGHDVCISQGAFICTGSHDRRSRSFEFDNAPVVIGDGAWVAARAIVLRGVSVGNNATIGAGTVVHESIKDREIVFATRKDARNTSSDSP